MRPIRSMVNEKTQIAGARNVLAAARPCCVQVIKASVAAAVHNWNDQHTTGDWTRSLRSRVSATSTMLRGASLALCHDFLVCRRNVRVDQLPRRIRATNYGQVARVT
jgi:hypothetical protein